MHPVPLSKPEIGLEEAANVLSVLNSGWLTSGPWVEKLEASVAQTVGCKHVVAVNSCTSALIMVLKALDIKGEVILPSFTFAATANAVVLAGATPVFADIDYYTCNIDPTHVESLITLHTEAIMPVHFAGQSCDMAAIMAIAEQHGLAVVEDCAEALGATYHGRAVGSFSHSCFSFFPTKNITTGEGGAITTDDARLAAHCRYLRAHGVVSNSWARNAVLPGYNFRMSDILASIGVSQMRKLDSMNRRRWSAAGYLNMRLPEELDLPIPAEGLDHVYQMYTVKLRGADRDRRNEFVEELRSRGIGASVHFDPPVHRQSFYKDCEADLPVTDRVSSEIVTLPLFPSITTEQLDHVVRSIKGALEA